MRKTIMYAVVEDREVAKKLVFKNPKTVFLLITIVAGLRTVLPLLRRANRFPRTDLALGTISFARFFNCPFPAVRMDDPPES